MPIFAAKLIVLLSKYNMKKLILNPYIHMKYLTCLLLLIFHVTSIFGQQVTTETTESYNRRPKIAVVLAGGGAKGVAHIPVLKAIEDAGIPVDLVVGTSIGSIVGGLYCTGYSPDTMRQIISETDWIKLISDNPDFYNLSLSGKKADELFVLRQPIDLNRWRSSTGMGGVIQGRNVLRFFRKLTRFLPDSLDFADMPIPFACVGTNAINGSCQVFTQGNVPLAMRASMAIPSVFTPVTIDSVVYVDGGICDNFPVDIARQMGADIVIGVDLKVNLTDQQLANNALELLLNCLDLYSKDIYQNNVRNSDIYIPIDVTGYNAASFTPDALDTLMARGERYAALKKPQLDSLRATLHLDEEPIRIRVGDYTFAKTKDENSSWNLSKEQETRRSLYRANDGSLNSAICIGGRFDNHEYATLLLKANMVLSEKTAGLLVLQGRLGARLDAKVDYSWRTIGSQRMGLSYRFQKNDLDMYNMGKKIIDLDMRLNKFNLYFTQEWHNIKYTFGLNYNMFQYEDVMLDKERVDYFDTKEKYFSYFVKGEVNTLNYQHFPTSGHRFELTADLLTDNMFSYQNKAMMPIFSGTWLSTFSPNEHFTLIPHLFARIMITEDLDEPLAAMNVIGGLFEGQHLLQQSTMAGLDKIELIQEDGIGIVGLTAQYSPFKNHFIQLTGDVCTHTNHLENVFNSDSRNWGIEASYNIRTAVGPIGIKGYWSDMNKRFAMTINAGYYF